MISSYCFSLVGRDHIKNHMPCHDSSLIKSVSSSWKIAVVADGVGSCKHTLFRQYVRDNNPDWTEEQIDDLLRKYSNDNNEDIPSESKSDIELKSDLTEEKMNNTNPQSSIPEDQLELDKEITGVTNELTEKIEKLPIKEQKKIIKVIHTLLEE